MMITMRIENSCPHCRLYVPIKNYMGIPRGEIKNFDFIGLYSWV